ncbi:MAG: SCP2 sterol-binding domain-containing protein [Pseudomonadales bacterium]
MQPGPGLHTAAVGILEQAVQRALLLDPATCNALADISGKLFHLELEGPEIDIYIRPDENTIYLKGFHDGEVDTHLRGAPSDFIALVAAEDAGSELINGNIVVRGDTSSLLKLQSILHSLDLDWEGELARLVGDIPAHELGKLVRKGAKWLRFAHQSALRQLEEYLHEEGRLLPARAELEGFYDDVDALSQRVERLQARAEKMRSKLQAGQ